MVDKQSGVTSVFQEKQEFYQYQSTGVNKQIKCYTFELFIYTSNQSTYQGFIFHGSTTLLGLYLLIFEFPLSHSDTPFFRTPL